MELPDLKGREEILKVHAKKVKLDESVDFSAIARMASGASGAEHPAVSVRARREGDYLFVKVENPSPPPAPPREGRGTGTRILTDLTRRYGGAYCGEYRGGVFTAVASLALAPEECPGRALGEASS